MSFLLECPVCGPREVADFAFYGEASSRPSGVADRRALFAYVYMRRNACGPQREWWQHRSGCRSWFLAARDTRTNQVLWTALAADAPPEAAE